MTSHLNVHSERGVALIAASMAIMLLLALGTTLILVTSSETAIAANFRSGGEAQYAAAAAVERAIAEIRDVADWNLLLEGTQRSSFVDGASGGTRRLADGSVIDLAQVLSLANCARRTTCSSGDMNATTNARPWGTNNPRWTWFAHGTLDDLAGLPSQDSPFYVAAMVADDGAENDDEPTRDGVTVGPLSNPGKNIILVRGEAFGPHGAHRTIEVVIARYRMDELDLTAPWRIQVRSWKEF